MAGYATINEPLSLFWALLELVQAQQKYARSPGSKAWLDSLLEMGIVRTTVISSQTLGLMKPLGFFRCWYWSKPMNARSIQAKIWTHLAVESRWFSQYLRKYVCHTQLFRCWCWEVAQSQEYQEVFLLSLNNKIKGIDEVQGNTADLFWSFQDSRSGWRVKVKYEGDTKSLFRHDRCESPLTAVNSASIRI